MKILIIDSGIGGISILNYLKKKHPHNQYTYLMDNKNFPYGRKTQSELKQILISEILPYTNNYDYIVVACNTLSTIIEKDKITLNSPTITMLDLHKINAPIYANKKIYLLATPLSVESNIWQNIYKNVQLISGSDLATWIEKKQAHQIGTFINSLPLDCPIILSCTHYNFVKNMIFNSVDITNCIDYLITKSTGEYNFKLILTNQDTTTHNNTLSLIV